MLRALIDIQLISFFMSEPLHFPNYSLCFLTCMPINFKNGNRQEEEKKYKDKHMICIETN